MKPNDKYRLKVPIADTELLDLGTGGVMASVATVEDTTGVFDDWRMQFRPVPGYPNEMYAPFGIDNQLPYKIRELIGSDEVTAQNKLFNVLTCYGAGLQLQDEATKQATQHADARRFLRRNALSSFYLEQITDMKYYFFAVCIVILSKDGSTINRLVHKDACFCRLTIKLTNKMKAINILRILLSESVNTENCGIVKVYENMPYTEFIRQYLCHDFQDQVLDYHRCVAIEGEYFYCWHSTKLNFCQLQARFG